MRLRTRHLACVLLLLSSIGAAQGSASVRGIEFRGYTVVELLYRAATATQSDYALSDADISRANRQRLASMSAGAHTCNIPWTMHPPASQSTTVQTVTGLVPESYL